MTTTSQIAKQLRELHQGDNWTGVNLRDTLKGITWQQSVARVHHLNTIAMLMYHINYYVEAAISVVQGGQLSANDKYAFDAPEISSEEDWQKLVGKVATDTETLAAFIEKMDDSKLSETFADAKFGNYYRNLTGIIEHSHYHLGQIVLIKKILNEN